MGSTQAWLAGSGGPGIATPLTPAAWCVYRQAHHPIRSLHVGLDPLLDTWFVQFIFHVKA